MEVLKVRRNAEETEVTVQLLPLEDLDVDAISQGDELNLLVAGRIDDAEMVGLMFGPMDEGEAIFLCPPDTNWPRLLAHLKCFPSASQAAKNLKSQRKPLDIIGGFHDFKIGKARKVRVCLWKPMHGDWGL